MIVSKPQELLKKKDVSRLAAEWQAAALLGAMVCAGCWPLSARKDATPAGGVRPSGAPGVSAAVQRKNAELLREMMGVVLGEKVFFQTLDRGAFGDWVDSLNQGMSLEGAYRGIVYGERYRGLVDAQLNASEGCRQMFDAVIQGFGSGAGARAGVGAYALKREAGERALAWVESFVRRDAELATAFGRWAVDAAAAAERAGMDFAVAPRMSREESFHRAWAAGVLARGERDRVIWEVLTRVHRLMNRGCGVV